MELRDYSKEALMLLEIAQILKSQMRAIKLSRTTVQGSNISEDKTEHETYINTQDIVISDVELFDKCTSAEWHLIGRISRALYKCNAIWKWPQELRSNGSIQKAVKGLITKNVLAKTDTTGYYIVNPLVLRRGKDWKVAITTAQAIHNNNGIDEELLNDLRPIENFTFINNNNTQLLGYGYQPED